MTAVPRIPRPPTARMRALLLRLLMVLAAFTAVPAAAQVDGTWILLQVNDIPMQAQTVDEDGTVMEGVTVRLDTGGRYSFRVRTRSTGGGEPGGLEITGTYEVAGDQLRLQPDEGMAADPMAFRWQLRDGTLLLVNDDDDAYTFARQEPVVAEAAAAAAGEPWPPGTWNAVRINGQPIPAPWPQEPGLTITRLSFEFTEDGEATARLAGTIAGETAEEVNRGRYRIEGARLIILDDEGAVDEEFGWRLGDGTLVLVDKHGHTYTLAPAPVP